MKKMERLLTFRTLSQMNAGNIYIFVDKIIAVRTWGEGGVRIFTVTGSFDVANTLEEVLEKIRNGE